MKIVITGGPCVGKTTLINLLKSTGLSVVAAWPPDVLDIATSLN